MSTSFSGHLLNRRRAFIPTMQLAMGTLASAHNKRSAFIAFLIQTYHYVKYSCPLMEMAAARLKDDCPNVSEYLLQHIEEEGGHEEWVLSDLSKLGVDVERIRSELPPIEAVSMIGSQLYIIQEMHAIGFLGYVFALESVPPTDKTIASMSRHFEVPLEALSVFTGHAEADPGHMEELCQVIDANVQSTAHQSIIEYNVSLTIDCVFRLFTAAAQAGASSEEHSRASA